MLLSSMCPGTRLDSHSVRHTPVWERGRVVDEQSAESITATPGAGSG
jgi:hypothetical protein